MSGYWSAIAAAARGGAAGQRAAVPVPSIPLFASEVGGEDDDWGAVDIETSAPKPGERLVAASASQTEVPPAADESQAIPAQAAAPAPAIRLPPAAMSSSDVDEDGPAPLSASDEAERHPERAVAEPSTVTPILMVSGLLPEEVAEPPGPPAAAAAARAVMTVPADGDEPDVADEGARHDPAIAEAAPVFVAVEAMPAVTAAGTEPRAFDDTDVDGSSGLPPPPIHIHIDRIDVRLTEGDAGSARAARRQVAPVVALDEFLRRPSERQG